MSTQAPPRLKLTVRDVMTSPAITVEPTTPFKRVSELLTEWGISAVPVVDADGRIVGIVSERDLMLKEAARSAAPRTSLFGAGRAERAKSHGMVASAVMTNQVVTIAPDATVTEAARLMHDRDLKRLPVVDARGSLAGMVSRRDVLKVFLVSDDDIRRTVLEGVALGQLWMDPSRLSVSVNAGVVTLAGTLRRRSEIDILVRLVEALDSVVAVDNRLAYEYDDMHDRPGPPEARIH